MNILALKKENQIARFTICCVHPELKKTGSWLFTGESHRIPGTSISPFFNDVAELFKWANSNGWRETYFN